MLCRLFKRVGGNVCKVGLNDKADTTASDDVENKCISGDGGCKR